MFRTAAFTIVFLLLLPKCFALIETPTIHTSNGIVKGLKEYTVWNSTPYSSFKGIPYAVPPLGRLRFQAPVEIPPWEGVLHAFEEGSVCPQYDFVFNYLTGNEDCLYLNVYTPEIEFSEQGLQHPKPVMVWIYGGAFSSGYGNSSLYGPDFFLEEGVVLVTFNYRLGALGFLSLGHPEALGNAALKDQLLVLQWVQKNINRFGGDPNQVTIFGQSAGGVGVDLHVISKKSRGLFHRSISMSASVINPWAMHSPEMAQERAFKLAHRLGITTSDKDVVLDALRNISAYEIVDVTANLTLIDLAFKPTLEDPKLAPEKDIFISECTLEKYKTGDYAQLPHLMGYTHDEVLHYASYINILEPWVNRTVEIVNSLLPTTLTFTFTGEVQKLYYGFFYTLVTLFSDLIFVAEIDYKQKLLSKHNNAPIYYYILSYDSEYAYNKVVKHYPYPGTAHGDDTGYIFNTPLLSQVPTDPRLPFNVFRKKMVHLWANFAKFADPTPFGNRDRLLNLTWPDSRDSGEQLIIDEDLIVAPRQTDDQTKLYEEFVPFVAPVYTGCNTLVSKFIRIL